MRSRTFILHFPFFLLLLLLFSSCDVGQDEGTLESLEQNYRQIRSVNRDAEIVTADFVRNLQDSLAIRIADSLINTADSIQLSNYQDRIDSIEKSTFAIIDRIDEHLSVMESMAVKNPETGRFQSKEEEDNSHRYWKNKNNAEAIRQALISYESALSLFSGDVKFKINELYDNNLWLQFSNPRPVIAYLALLEGLKASIYTYERSALRFLFGQFGTPYFRSGNLILFNQPESQIVTAGMPFKSSLQVGLTTTRVKSRFEGNSVYPNDDSVSARIEVAADGSLIPAGTYTGTQQYKAKVSVPRADGGYVDLYLEESFTVLRPLINIQSSGAQILYRQCENVLSIDVPALEQNFRPQILASDAEVKLVEEGKKIFAIAPNSDSCLITVNTLLGDSSIKIDEVLYRVIDPPKPSIELWVNDQMHNGFSLIPRTSRLNLRVIPDPEFLEAYPMDARYGFTTVDVMIQQDMGTPKVVKTVNGLTREGTKGVSIDLGPDVEKAFPGTTIYLRINEIFRKNFAGQDLPEKRFTESERIIGLVVR